MKRGVKPFTVEMCVLCSSNTSKLSHDEVIADADPMRNGLSLSHRCSLSLIWRVGEKAETK